MFTSGTAYEMAASMYVALFANASYQITYIYFFYLLDLRALLHVYVEADSQFITGYRLPLGPSAIGGSTPLTLMS